jgi:hypothetical protein
LHRREPFGLGVDRAAHEPVLRLPRREAANRRGEILEQHGGGSRLRAPHPADRVGEPGLGRAGEHDLAGRIAVGGVDEHVPHASQARELRELIGDAAAVGKPGGEFGFQPRERHLPQRHGLSQIAGQGLDGGLTAFLVQARIGHRVGAEHALGVHDHAGTRDLTPGDRRRQAGRHHRGQPDRAKQDTRDKRSGERAHGDSPGLGGRRGRRTGG